MVAVLCSALRNNDLAAGAEDAISGTKGVWSLLLVLFALLGAIGLSGARFPLQPA